MPKHLFKPTNFCKKFCKCFFVTIDKTLEQFGIVILPSFHTMGWWVELNLIRIIFVIISITYMIEFTTMLNYLVIKFSICQRITYE